MSVLPYTCVVCVGVNVCHVRRRMSAIPGLSVWWCESLIGFINIDCDKKWSVLHIGHCVLVCFYVCSSNLYDGAGVKEEQ